MPAPTSPKKHNRLGIIFAKVNPKIRKRIDRQAKREGISLSDVVRRAVLRDLEQLEQSQRRLSA